MEIQLFIYLYVLDPSTIVIVIRSEIHTLRKETSKIILNVLEKCYDVFRSILEGDKSSSF
jgi:hypothetical protein